MDKIAELFAWFFTEWKLNREANQLADFEEKERRNREATVKDMVMAIIALVAFIVVVIGFVILGVAI